MKKQVSFDSPPTKLATVLSEANENENDDATEDEQLRSELIIIIQISYMSHDKLQVIPA